MVTKGQESNHLKRSKVKYVCIQMIDTEFDFYLYFFFFRNTVCLYSSQIKKLSKMLTVQTFSELKSCSQMKSFPEC